MSRKKHTLSSLLPYGFIVLMIIALIMESKDGLPVWANEITAIGIVLVVFSGILLWHKLNTATMQDEEIELAKHEKLIITEYPPTLPPIQSPNDDDQNNHGDLLDALQINQVTHYRN